jgi:hypothetical protein
MMEVSLSAPIGELAWDGFQRVGHNFRQYVSFLATLLSHQSSGDLQSPAHSAHQITAKQLLSRLDFNLFYAHTSEEEKSRKKSNRMQTVAINSPKSY